MVILNKYKPTLERLRCDPRAGCTLGPLQYMYVLPGHQHPNDAITREMAGPLLNPPPSPLVRSYCWCGSLHSWCDPRPSSTVIALLTVLFTLPQFSHSSTVLAFFIQPSLFLGARLFDSFLCVWEGLLLMDHPSSAWVMWSSKCDLQNGTFTYESVIPYKDTHVVFLADKALLP